MSDKVKLAVTFSPEIAKLLNEQDFSASQISATEIENPEMEIIFLKNNVEILTRRINVLCRILNITDPEALYVRPY